MNDQPTYPNGTKFTMRNGKVTRICTVVDYWVTRNLAGEIVRTRYVATHEMLGQPIFDYDVVAVTIARNLIK